MVISELRAVAFVEDKDDAFVPQRLQLFFVGRPSVLFLLLVALAVFIQGQTQLLDGGDNHLVGIVLGKETAHESAGIRVFLHAPLLEFIELLAGLSIEILTVHDKEAFFDVGIVLEESGCLERSERLTAAGGVPDVAIAAVLVNGVHDLFDRINLIWTHHEQLLLAGDEHHVAADHLAQGAFHQEGFGEAIEVGDLFVVLRSKLVNRQETLLRIKGEMAGIVVGEIESLVPIADNEELEKAEKGLGITVTRIVFILNDLLHRPTRIDSEGFQLDLHDRYPVDEQDYIEAVMAVVRVDTELADDLESVFAPVPDVYQGVIERGAIVAGEAIALAKRAGRRIDIRGDNLLKESVEFTIRKIDPVESFKFFPKILLQRSTVPDVGSVDIFEALELLDET